MYAGSLYPAGAYGPYSHGWHAGGVHINHYRQAIYGPPRLAESLSIVGLNIFVKRTGAAAG